MVLNAIYEEDFRGFSYGFRPKRSQHDALDALIVGITTTKVNWILEVDIRSFFDEVSRKRRGLGKPETFDFLGFTLVCGNSRRGRFLLKRRSRRDRMKAKLQDVSNELRCRMHQSIPEQGKWLKQVVTGYFAYHAVPTNSAALVTFRDQIVARWRWVLRRRSQKGALTWARMKKLADDWLPKPQILHPWPNQRFAVKHPR